eukprot:GHUV01043017.1.p1 GENE.GHUV01043017.1~~GHUV01043017.1.p1  ORF type:complete len:181 (-),score=94.32 GHUV01043017.1:98-640(-)
MLKMCAAPTTASPRNMLKTLLSRPSLTSSKAHAAPSSCDVGHPVCFKTTISSPRSQAGSNTSLALDVKLRPVHTSLKVEVQQCGDMAVDGADVSSASGACWPPTDSHLGNLPSHLLVYIAELAAPMTWQSLAAAPGGRPDIKPTLMACPPITAEQQQQQLEEQEQQAQQAQQQQAQQAQQ